MSEKKPAANEPETNVERRSSSSQQDFGALVARHRNYFRSGATRPVEWRGRQVIAVGALVEEPGGGFFPPVLAGPPRHPIAPRRAGLEDITNHGQHTPPP